VRVEQVTRTLQGRLVKALRLADISDMAAGNAVLPNLLERSNARFAAAPAQPEDRHRSLELRQTRLRNILCRREQRYVGRQLTLSYTPFDRDQQGAARRSCGTQAAE
jgi:hypothetical protein